MINFKKKFTVILLLATFIINQSIIGVKAVEGNEEKVEDTGYSTALPKNDEGNFITVSPNNFRGDTVNKIKKEESNGYKEDVVDIKEKQKIQFEVEVTKEGTYEFEADYFVKSTGLLKTQSSIKVNGEYQSVEAKSIAFSVLWESESDEFGADRFGNETMTAQNQVDKWYTSVLRPDAEISNEALKLKLKKGKNTIELYQNSGEIYLGEVRVSEPKEKISYEDYKKLYENEKLITEALIIKEGEKPSYKNSTGIRPQGSKDLEVIPYDTNKLLLNTLGGESWNKSGQEVYYEVEASESGLYKIAFKVNQSYKIDSNIYRNITIDFDEPFEEAKSFKLPYTNGWKTINFGDQNGEYEIYLEKGKHYIGLGVDSTKYQNAINELDKIMNEISDLSLEIKKLVGNNNDPNREWNISDYIPDLTENLNKMIKKLENQLEYISDLNDGKDTVKECTLLKLAIKNLKALQEDPDKIPSKLQQLSDGSGSVGQLLGDTISEMKNQPLSMDQVYIYGDSNNLPIYNSSIVERWAEGTKRFFSSFIPNKEEKVDKETKVINVWVNRQRNYVDLMQNITDNEFTKKTGIKVNFSVMPNEQKLILANSAGTQPDVALGISTWLPYELASRNVALDIKDMDGFKDLSADFSEGAFLPLMKDGEVYGLPETQDFYTLFYRKDILNSLNIPVPDTWDDVKNILPELQRYGMNFYDPLASSGAFKAFMTTSPFIYQTGGSIYAEDAMSAGLNDEKTLEAIKLMTDLFTMYGLPMQVPNFYNHFRYGTLPIGIGNFSTYLKLKNAAPEIAGQWEMAPHPGIENSEGEVERWSTGSAQSSMIFNETKLPNESWEFLKWWMSTETQTTFSYQLQNLYGQEYVWNSANVNAFKQSPIDIDDKEIILEQWKWLYEVPKIPGSYMVERELSNIWNKVVFDGENPRSAIDDSMITMNREIARKMEEFGYMKDGKVVKPYELPSIKDVESWVKD